MLYIPASSSSPPPHFNISHHVSVSNHFVLCILLHISPFYAILVFKDSGATGSEDDNDRSKASIDAVAGGDDDDNTDEVV